MNREWTTYHEASHAVVALRLGWTVHHIVIATFQDGITCADPPAEPADWREDCTIRVAGLVGERRVRGTADVSDVAEDERKEALALAREHAPESAELEVRSCEERAAAILDEDWSVVTKIATLLLNCDLINGPALERLLAE